jgi:glycosyltransferase involved in cell wall biosynthesis
MRILSVADQAGWAYHRVGTDLKKYVKKHVAEWILETANLCDLITLNLNKYDVILLWPWISSEPPTIHNEFIPLELKHRTIHMVCSQMALDIALNNPAKLKHVNYIGTVTNDMTKTLQTVYPDKSIFALPHGVDTDLFTPKELPDVFTVCWIGKRSRQLKHYSKAWITCKRAGVPLKTAGWIKDPDYLQQESMPDFYNSCSVLLITSETEGHPLIYYEALACGRPVISTLVGDIPDTAKHGENGFYLKTTDPMPQYTDYLVRLRDNPELLKEMSEKARETALEWSWDTRIQPYLQAISCASNRYSAAMLVSRINDQMRCAISSVLKHNPSEFNAFIDETKIDIEDARTVILDVARTSSYEGDINVRKQVDTNAPNHHDDVTRSVHKAIISASYPRVLWLDDDDELLIDPRLYIPLLSRDVGMIYGDVRKIWSDGRTRVDKSKPILSPFDARYVQGSAVLYNRDAVRRIYRNIDVHRDDMDEEKPVWYGYFWDFQIGYWLKRSGCRMIYVPETWSVQNVNPNPGVDPYRLKAYKKWPEVVAWYDER